MKAPHEGPGCDGWGVGVLPFDWLRSLVVLADERMRFRWSRLEDLKMPRRIRSRSILLNHNSTWLSHDEYVGVK